MRKNDIAADLLADLTLACMLLTRLPLPALPDAAFARQTRAAWAYPLAGAVVALTAGLAGLAGLALGLPAAAAAGLVLATQIAATGAMHEDGLADSADGLWGGRSRARRLEIMRDSAVGSYGVLALILSLGLRWVALAGLIGAGTAVATGALIAAAALSRALLPALMTALPPARGDGLARAMGRPGGPICAAALGLGAALALLAAGPGALTALVPAAAAVALLARTALGRIGGQTGDILGAAQQIAEIAILLTLLALN